MGKKRRSDSCTTRLDEVDRSMYTTFSGAANSLSQLYTQAMNQQKLSFQAGERHALDKLYNWILRQQENGSRMTLGDITSYLENELEYLSEESPLRSMNSSEHQPKNSSVFSNALSSPVRRTLQHYHLPQGGGDNGTPSLNTLRSTENGYRESNAPTSNDSSMDMQADSPAQKSLY